MNKASSYCFLAHKLLLSCLFHLLNGSINYYCCSGQKRKKEVIGLDISLFSHPVKHEPIDYTPNLSLNLTIYSLTSLVLMTLPLSPVSLRGQLTDRPHACWVSDKSILLAAQVIFWNTNLSLSRCGWNPLIVPIVWRIKWKSIAWPTVCRVLTSDNAHL